MSGQVQKRIAELQLGPPGSGGDAGGADEGDE